MSDQTGVWYHDRDEDGQNERYGPSWDLCCANWKLWAVPVCFDRLDAEKEEDPDGCAQDGSVAAKDAALDDNVHECWNGGKC